MEYFLTGILAIISCISLPTILVIALLTYKFKLNKPLTCYSIASIWVIATPVLTRTLSLDSLFSIPFGILILGSIYWGGASLITNVVIKRKGIVQISETSKDYIFCPKCGTKAKMGDNFCFKCGAKLPI